jgi:hypothetical protein
MMKLAISSAATTVVVPMLTGCYSTGNSSGLHARLSERQLKDRVLDRFPTGTLRPTISKWLSERRIPYTEHDGRLIATFEDPWWVATPLAAIPGIRTAVFSFDKSGGLTDVRWEEAQ